MYSLFIATLFTNAKIWEQPKSLSTGEWIEKMWCVCAGTHTHTHTYIGLLLSHKKRNEIFSFGATWKVIMLCEGSQTKTV